VNNTRKPLSTRVKLNTNSPDIRACRTYHEAKYAPYPIKATRVGSAAQNLSINGFIKRIDTACGDEPQTFDHWSALSKRSFIAKFSQFVSEIIPYFSEKLSSKRCENRMIFQSRYQGAGCA
jgi:hypothetical protein